MIWENLIEGYVMMIITSYYKCFFFFTIETTNDDDDATLFFCSKYDWILEPLQSIAWCVGHLNCK